MDRVFEPGREPIRSNATLMMMWASAALLMLSLIWGGTLVKLQHDTRQAQAEAVRLASARARIYAEQLLKTVKAIDQISLTIAYQWQHLPSAFDLTDQYEKAMHHTPTYPTTIGADGRVLDSWRRESVGIDYGQANFFAYHRDHADDALYVSPVSTGVGGMTGKRTVRFTRRVNDASGNFAGVVLVSVEPSYVASISNEDDLNAGDFISVRLVSGPLLVVKTLRNRENSGAYYRADPVFSATQDVEAQPGERFIDGLPRYVAWKKIDGYPLVALAGITEASALAPYAPTRSAWLSFATVTSLLVVLSALSGSVMAVRHAERRRRAERLRATFRLAVDGAREAFLILEPIRSADGDVTDFQVQDCNERAAQLLRMPREQLLGRYMTHTFEGERRRQTLDFLTESLAQGFAESEYVIGSDELHQPGWYHRRAVRSGDAIAVTIRDITEAKLQEQALASLAVTDTLTGLPNRRWLNDYLPGALQRARAARKRVALLFMDLDNFKTINDTQGHAAGDEVLRAAALCVRSAVRSSDHVVRLGGDEFTVLLENVERSTDAETVAAQVVKAFASSEAFAHWAAQNVSCSVGVAVYPEHAQDADGLLQCADKAMYDAKTEGKNRYSVYHLPA